MFPLVNYKYTIPKAPHPGAFGVVRKHHTHEGVDLYADDGDPVVAICDGVVVNVYPFTGEAVGMPWWNETYAVAVEDDTGVWVYGEITPSNLVVGQSIMCGQLIGTVKQVLRVDKGRPMSMLHLERWKKNTVPYTFLWGVGEPQPTFLEDPTPLLFEG